ncbi:hypothetical protein ES702_00408 [subsurface metagenome]
MTNEDSEMQNEYDGEPLQSIEMNVLPTLSDKCSITRGLPRRFTHMNTDVDSPGGGAKSATR